MNIRFSPLSNLDADRFRQVLERGQVQVGISAGTSIVVARQDDIFALADRLAEEEQLEHMVSYRKNVTGVENTLFISPKVHARHAARVKVAIDPPDTVSPTSETISVSIHDGSIVAGSADSVTASLLEQVRRFVDLNRDVLLDYWEERIDTDELRTRLKSIAKT
jgi:hypothetical protein